MWSMLPGARTLSPSRISEVRSVVRTGYATIHTLQGWRCSTTPKTVMDVAPAITKLGMRRPSSANQQEQSHEIPTATVLNSGCDTRALSPDAVLQATPSLTGSPLPTTLSRTHPAWFWTMRGLPNA